MSGAERKGQRDMAFKERREGRRGGELMRDEEERKSVDEDRRRGQGRVTGMTGGFDRVEGEDVNTAGRCEESQNCSPRRISIHIILIYYVI